MNFSDKLKEIRKTEGLSQEKFAEKIGVSRQAITKWETGKGMPDIENMKIISEVYKMTLDELLCGKELPKTEEPHGYESEMIYDVDCRKHFDLKFGRVNQIKIVGGMDEKLHIRLYSDTIENIASIYKMKLEERKDRLEVTCVKKEEISEKVESESLNILITLPTMFSKHCEVLSCANYVCMERVLIDHLEFDGDVKNVDIIDSKGSFEFTTKSACELTLDHVVGSVSTYQLLANSVVHMMDGVPFTTRVKGHWSKLFVQKDGIPIDHEDVKGAELEIAVTGVKSEMVIDLQSNESDM